MNPNAVFIAIVSFGVANYTLRSGGGFLHPSLDFSPGAQPLLVASEPGRGRVVVLATGSTWRLGFAADLPLVDGARRLAQGRGSITRPCLGSKRMRRPLSLQISSRASTRR